MLHIGKSKLVRRRRVLTHFNQLYINHRLYNQIILNDDKATLAIIDELEYNVGRMLFESQTT